jgi:hypothetical protein
MDETGQKPAISSPQNPSTLHYEGQVIEKPISVTVFGVLNIALGCYQLIQFYLMFFKMVPTYKGLVTIEGLPYLLLVSIISVGLPVWLIILGIGLLKMKTWARNGSCMYARIRIIVTVITMGLSVASLIINMSAFPMAKLLPVILVMLLGLIETFIYPLLILIFMQSAKVKQAFAVIER